MAKTKIFDEHISEYENWFIKNDFIYQSELKAVEKAIPKNKNGFEIGIGSGLFAKPLGIKEGIEPSTKMREKAIEKGLIVKNAVAEDLPYEANEWDFALMVTTICFLDDIYKSFQEVYRVLKNEGQLIIAFVDKNSPVGRTYLENKHKSLFYKDAFFWGTEEITNILEETGFIVKNIYQTIFGQLNEINQIQEVVDGFGNGSFIVIQAQRD